MTNDDKSRRKVTQTDQHSSNADGSGSKLDEHLQAHIGSQLKSMYDSYLNEPIPDRLVELLEKLDEVSRDDAESTASNRDPKQ